MSGYHRYKIIIHKCKTGLPFIRCVFFVFCIDTCLCSATYALQDSSRPTWFTQGFVLDNDEQLFPASYAFINSLSREVFEKSGISVYVVALKGLRDYNLESLKQSLSIHLRSPYLYILFIREEKKIDIQGSIDVISKIPASDIYWNYIVPLIPKKDSEINPSSIAAFLINGYIALVQELSIIEQIKLDNQYVPQTKTVESTTRIALYFMTFTLLALFIMFIVRKKKYEK